MRIGIAILLLSVFVGGTAAQGEPAPAPGLRQQADAELQRLDCQTDLPGEARGGGRAGRGRPGDRERPGERERPGDPEPRVPGQQVDGVGGSAEVAKVLFWLLLAGIAALAIVAVSRHFGARAQPQPRPSIVRASPGPAPAPEPVPDHVRLAQQGRFAEAIHALLLAALQLLVEHLGRGLPRHTTGREAVQLARAVPQGDQALLALVRSVEHSRFGGSAVDAADYDAAVLQFEHWSQACRSPRR